MSNSIDGRTVTSKLAAILRTFSSGSEHSLSDVARSAGIPLSTAHRLVAELVEGGLLDRTVDRRYCVGALLTQIGGTDWNVPRLNDFAHRTLDDLSAAVRTTVRFGVIDAGVVRYLERRYGAGTIEPARQPRQTPVHSSAMGKALAAFAERHTVDAIVTAGLPQYTPTTIGSAAAFRRELADIRVTHIAWERGETRSDTFAIAVPVFARGGRVIGALEASTTGAGAQPLNLQAIQPAVTVAARSLSREIGSNGRRRTPAPTVRDQVAG